jgi:hypothetical protein
MIDWYIGLVFGFRGITPWLIFIKLLYGAASPEPSWQPAMSQLLRNIGSTSPSKQISRRFGGKTASCLQEEIQINAVKTIIHMSSRHNLSGFMNQNKIEEFICT